jgi:hypothetical protein
VNSGAVQSGDGIEIKKMDWIKTTSMKPPRGRIVIWYDDDVFSANVLENGVVDCRALEMAWDLNVDQQHEWFSHWGLLTVPNV